MPESLYRHVVFETKYFLKNCLYNKKLFYNYWTDQTKNAVTKTNIEYDLFKPKEWDEANTKHFFGK